MVGGVVWICGAVSPELLIGDKVKVEDTFAAEKTLRNHRGSRVGDPFRQTARRHLVVARTLTSRLSPRRVTVAHVFYEKHNYVRMLLLLHILSQN